MSRHRIFHSRNELSFVMYSNSQHTNTKIVHPQNPYLASSMAVRVPFCLQERVHARVVALGRSGLMRLILGMSSALALVSS